ncbi:polymorphic toxin type 44 domain-containing protein [Microbacterium sp. 3J1]|uniref:polymorphic toxin type 44 domain-containing protein n=1 Tax=Microbacterium sp. 3J1 TaxID=861269 RepID=UPI000AA37A55|nr:polymorphic toxin type 44 domain-containing protein [Microbacterium sp. 3J1]
MIHTDGVWDAKPYILQDYGYTGGTDQQFYVRTSDGSSKVRADVFGNVNYGIMMASFGVGDKEAIMASNIGDDASGQIDSFDDSAISLGYQMADKYPGGVPLGAYQDMILSEFGNKG